jgi:hypothetical protein
VKTDGTEAVTMAPPISRSARERDIGRATILARSSRNAVSSRPLGACADDYKSSG